MYMNQSIFDMKKTVFVFTLVALLLSGCTGKTDKLGGKKGSSGKTLELMVVADKEVYSGEIKALVDSIFGGLQDCLPQPEKKFDIVHIAKTSFESVEMFRVHRNVLLLDINPGNNNKVYRHKDKYAAPQVIFDMAAKDRKSLDSMIRAYEETIMSDMYEAEHKRVWKAYKGEEGYEIEQKVKEKLGVELTLSQNYGVAKMEKDFGWVRIEAKDFGMGILVQKYDYKDKGQFDEKRMLDSLDSMMCRHVPGPSEGSYMGIERRRDSVSGKYLMEIKSRTVQFPTGTYCVETRGCWRLFGNYMGGPFVSYAVLSPDNKELVTVTGYVYCPRNKPYTKRDLLMQLESVCYSLKF